MAHPISPPYTGPADGRHPWDRMRGESQQAYAALKLFLDLGSERSQVATAVKAGRSEVLIRRWHKKYGWIDRAEAYDSHLNAIEMAKREKVRAAYAEKAERFRMESANAHIDIVSRLAERAQQMLESPLYEQVIEEAYEDGRPRTIVMTPAKWDLKTAALFAKTASDLMQVIIFQLSFPKDDDFDPLKATPEELRAYLERNGYGTGMGSTDGVGAATNALPAPDQSIDS